MKRCLHIVCKCQGHNARTCRNGSDQRKKLKGGQVGVKKGEKTEVEGSQLMEIVLPEVEGTKLASIDIVV